MLLEGALENRRPSNQPRRQRRPPGAILIDRLFQEFPIDRARKLHQGAVNETDPARQFPPLPWSRRTLHPLRSICRESEFSIRRHPQIRIRKKIDTETANSGKIHCRNLQSSPSSIRESRARVLHGRLNILPAEGMRKSSVCGAAFWVMPARRHPTDAIQ